MHLLSFSSSIKLDGFPVHLKSASFDRSLLSNFVNHPLTGC
jgi:hypothetical protein